MDKTIAFRFSLEVQTTIKLEKVKETDYGAQRYVKQLVNAFEQEPDALRIIALTNFIDFFCGDYREELEPLLGKLENVRSAILRVAQKCPPEASRFFSDLFAPGLPNRTEPGNEGEDSLLAADTGEEPDSDDEAHEREVAKTRESEWVFGELLERLCQFAPVKATFSELSPGNRKPPLEQPEHREPMEPPGHMEYLEPLEQPEQLEQLELQG